MCNNKKQGMPGSTRAALVCVEGNSLQEKVRHARDCSRGHQNTEQTTRDTHVTDATSNKPASSTARRLGYARCSKTSPPCCTHKTKRRRGCFAVGVSARNGRGCWLEQDQPRQRMQQPSGTIQHQRRARGSHCMLEQRHGWHGKKCCTFQTAHPSVRMHSSFCLQLVALWWLVGVQASVYSLLLKYSLLTKHVWIVFLVVYTHQFPALCFKHVWFKVPCLGTSLRLLRCLAWDANIGHRVKVYNVAEISSKWAPAAGQRSVRRGRLQRVADRAVLVQSPASGRHWLAEKTHDL